MSSTSAVSDSPPISKDPSKRKTAALKRGEEKDEGDS